MGKDTTENSIPVCPEENGTIKKTPPEGQDRNYRRNGVTESQEAPLWVQQRTFQTGLTGKAVTPAPVLHPIKE